jgi:hypothetical protein
VQKDSVVLHSYNYKIKTDLTTGFKFLASRVTFSFDIMLRWALRFTSLLSYRLQGHFTRGYTRWGVYRWNLERLESATPCHLTVAPKTLKSFTSRDITPCSPLKANRRFGGICRPHLQGQRISQARNQSEALSKQSSEPEDGGDTFLRKVG